MAVPGASSNYLKNTTGGAYVDQKQGGSILGNTTVGDVVTKALALKDNAVVFSRGTLPAAVVNGLITNQKVLSVLKLYLHSEQTDLAGQARREQARLWVAVKTGLRLSLLAVTLLVLQMRLMSSCTTLLTEMLQTSRLIALHSLLAHFRVSLY